MDQQYLQNSDKYFTSSEKSEISKCVANKKPIETYWLVAYLNFYGEEALTLADKEILTAIEDIST